MSRSNVYVEACNEDPEIMTSLSKDKSRFISLHFIWISYTLVYESILCMNIVHTRVWVDFVHEYRTHSCMSRFCAWVDSWWKVTKSLIYEIDFLFAFNLIIGRMQYKLVYKSTQNTF